MLRRRLEEVRKRYVQRIHRCVASLTNLIIHTIEPPAGQLRIASDDTRKFTAALISAARQRLPRFSLFSTGGNKINSLCYDDDKKTQGQLVEHDWNINDALANFTKTMHDVLRNESVTPAVCSWEGRFNHLYFTV